MVGDMRPKGLTGKEAQALPDRAAITVNKNTIPGDPQSPFVTSGVRIGTPAVTTRGFAEPQMEKVADFIDTVLTRKDDATIARVKAEVRELTEQFPLYAAPVRHAVEARHVWRQRGGWGGRGCGGLLASAVARPPRLPGGTDRSARGLLSL